ncbi:DUF4062 domain-containing protein [Pectobacterium odoriferum]|uniref:DUF4062 domain-containing protein n=1 Tax=Pectobacterium odoriferum TaxID=78398 RepID=UPI0015E17C34|nr:DUF4062 domain-containing protein [Pectobacterium odoriferum]
MQKPRFFLSSTIYDFKDLRSALKYYLEQQGCIVSASEYPDFKISADKHSYDSCLENIESSDYFILFIGARVGGWYDEENRISITQKEYRSAYELHKSGKIKILAFVRSEIWEHRENRAELRRYLKTIDLNPDIKSKIERHPSKICEDSDFIISFINEVSRNAETKKALSTAGSSLPTGNWIYTFHGFRDIVNAIQAQIISETPLEQSALKHLLRLELRENLRASLIRLKNDAISPEASVVNFYAEHEITLDTKNQSTTFVNAKRWRRLSTLGIQLLGIKLQTRVLEHCLRTSTFVDYDPLAGRATSTPTQNDLLNLAREIESFHLANKSDTLEVIFELSPKNGYADEQPIPVNTVKLLALMHLYDRWINVIKLSSSLVNYLSGSTYSSPSLRPRSPIPDMNAQLDAETVTDNLLDKFLIKSTT